MGRREGAGGAHGAAVLRLVVPGRASTAHCSGEVGGGITPAAVQPFGIYVDGNRCVAVWRSNQVSGFGKLAIVRFSI